VKGWVLGEEGELEEGIALIKSGQKMLQAIGAWLGVMQVLNLLAETYRKAGKISEGLAVLKEAQALIQKMGTWMEEPEVYRLQGELLLLRGESEPVVEEFFVNAVEVARRQGAKSWELRATMSLCRLWQKQGRIEEAKQALEDVYGWFSEGFETLDLMEANMLLKGLQ
jgi:predicted ATPase